MSESLSEKNNIFLVEKFLKDVDIILLRIDLLSKHGKLPIVEPFGYIFHTLEESDSEFA